MDHVIEMRDFVARVAMPGEDPRELGEDEDLFENGVLDSLSTLQLAVELERAFGVRVPPGAIGRERFGTVRRLAAFIAGQRREEPSLPVGSIALVLERKGAGA